MKIKDKYPQLQDEQYVQNMVMRSVFSSMCLEAQQVSMERIEELYAEVKNEQHHTTSNASIMHVAGS